MDELTRQRRATTRLLSGLLVLAACALVFGIYWTLAPRPAQTPLAAGAPSAPAPAKVAAAGSLPAAAPAVAVPASQARAVESSASATTKATSKTAALPHASAAHLGKARSAAAEAPLVPAPPPTPVIAAAETGLLSLDTTPWSTVSLGGRLLGTTPLVGASLPVGTHTLVLSNPELGLKTTYQVTITAGRTTARRVGLE